DVRAAVALVTRVGVRAGVVDVAHRRRRAVWNVDERRGHAAEESAGARRVRRAREEVPRWDRDRAGAAFVGGALADRGAAGEQIVRRDLAVVARAEERR